MATRRRVAICAYNGVGLRESTWSNIPCGSEDCTGVTTQYGSWSEPSIAPVFTPDDAELRSGAISSLRQNLESQVGSSFQRRSDAKLAPCCASQRVAEPRVSASAKRAPKAT